MTDVQVSDGLRDALERARHALANTAATWCPIFADIIIDDKKVGHVVSDGYTNTTWKFIPFEDLPRRSKKNIETGTDDPLQELVSQLPGWIRNGGFRFGSFLTFSEMKA